MIGSGLSEKSRQALLVTAIAAAVQVVSLLPRWMAHPTNSDDAYLSSILRTWRPFSEHAARVRDDTYLLHWPFYLAGDNLLGQSRSTLIVISIAMNLISLGLVIRFLFFVVRRLTDNHRVVSLTVASAAIWYASTAGPVADLLIRPSFRNLELGLVLLLIQLAVEAAERPELSRWRCAVVVGLSGLLMVDDPLNLYVVLAIAAMVGIRSIAPHRRSRQRLITAGLLGTGVVCFAAIRVIFWAVGLQIVPVPTTIISLSEVWASIANTAHWLLDLLGANVFGRDIKKPHTLLMAIRLAVLAGIGWLAYSFRRRLTASDLAVELSVVAFGALLFASIFSRNGLDAGNGRYLALCVTLIAVVIGFVVAQAEPTTRKILITALAFVIVANVVLSVRDLNAVRGADADRESRNVIATLESYELTDGYADYWESYTYTYLSDARVEILEVVCAVGDTAIRYGDVNRYRMDLDSSFFLFDSRPGLSTCSLEEIVRQFGEPMETIPVSPTKVALVYEYDIGSRITTLSD